jgi:putative Ca2+/H+ antiporter (TMEM165/GDT1 family)
LIEAALTAFVLIVPVGLPDKTFVATLVPATRYRALPVWLDAAVLFAAVVLFRGARRADEAEEAKLPGPRSGWRVALTSFAVLFTAEWGDLSQLLTAGLVASERPAVPVFLGSWAALVAVSGAAVLLGRWMLRRVKLSLIRYAAAGVCAVLAAVTAIGTLSAP